MCAGADGKPPTASSSERAGGDRHLVSSGTVSAFHNKLETF
jgi:hypothetical protein